MKALVQVAGVIDLAEARALLACGVDWLGFPLRLAVHRPDLGEDQAACVIRAADLAERAVLITYETDPAALVALAAALGFRRIQLHADCAPAVAAEVKSLNPALFLMKSLVVRPDNRQALLTRMQAFAPHVAAFITDTFDPKTGASGATGRVHDWTVSAGLVAASPRPVILAGGLTPDNVAEAVRAVRPAGVDAHTGLEGPDGRKDMGKVRLFVDRARAAFREAGLE
jgi:phosphoribosylanthranilate isomerase